MADDVTWRKRYARAMGLTRAWGWALAASVTMTGGCEGASEGSAKPQRADAAQPAPAAAGATLSIRGTDSAVTTAALPQHLRFAILLPDPAPPLALEGVVLRGDAGEEAVRIRELQVWSPSAEGPSRLELGAELALDGGEIELLVYLEAWEGDPLAQEYVFEGRFVVGGELLSVPVTIRRAQREARPGR